MDKLIDFLNKKNTSFDLGIINNGYYYKLNKPFKSKRVIRFKWKKNSINKLLVELKKIDIILNSLSIGKYNALYNIENSKNQVFIVYGVDSHVQLPKLLLKNFRTKESLYYLDTSTNIIKKSSARRYNTEFGYYSLYFEEYLSNNYESIIVNIIDTVMPFINNEVKNVTLKNLVNDVNKLFLMALFRNPKCIKEINDRSLSSKLSDDEYDAEQIALTFENMSEDFIKGFSPVPFVNKTNKGMLTLKSLISDFDIDNGVQCMVMVLHPEFAIALIPDNYLKKMIEKQGNKTYFQLNNEDALLRLNTQIYNCAKFNKDDVIGIKEDLEELLKNYE